MKFYFYYTSSLDCAPLFERAHDSEKVLVPLQPALQSFATTVPDKECIRHVQPHHVFTGQQCRNARFCSVAAPQSIKKCGSCCSMFTLPPPAPAITLLCTSCMPPVRACVYEGVYSCLLFHMHYPFFLRLDFASRCSRSIHRSKTQTHHRFVVATSRPSVCHQQRLSFEESNLFFYSLLNAYCSMYARCACKQSFTCKAQRRGYRDSICFVCVSRPRGRTTLRSDSQQLSLAEASQACCTAHTLYT